MVDLQQTLVICFGLIGLCTGQSLLSQGVQCYACGMPNIYPDNDIAGSYPTIKTYNHTCDEMFSTMVSGKISNKFIRTCPLGVVSCYAATGSYSHDDTDPSNDIVTTFLGCSESIYSHKFGCDKDLNQPVPVKDMWNKTVLVSVTVTMCFCNDQLCNDPFGDLMNSAPAKHQLSIILIFIFVANSFLHR